MHFGWNVLKGRHLWNVLELEEMHLSDVPVLGADQMIRGVGLWGRGGWKEKIV